MKQKKWTKPVIRDHVITQMNSTYSQVLPTPDVGGGGAEGDGTAPPRTGLIDVGNW